MITIISDLTECHCLLFCDEAGRLHQSLARVVGRVVFMVAGLPLVLKNDIEAYKKQQKSRS